ncbi:dexamethasone-induced protein isoform X1 [Rhinopithecus roxellana]|uniref:dexamethasone-induced protein isoform X1 n=1 Tax=Rhinopithecus roxellana TaxID=61622 RepID=UPI00123732DA|nr:dexamethasone-induced protein isoform X1 [Rhinopithecus roxellana]XP_030780953.1 dexamethasone-induced protein isoform X1 [Rhinopithecus roxellana]
MQGPAGEPARGRSGGGAPSATRRETRWPQPWALGLRGGARTCGAGRERQLPGPALDAEPRWDPRRLCEALRAPGRRLEGAGQPPSTLGGPVSPSGRSRGPWGHIWGCGDPPGVLRGSGRVCQGTSGARRRLCRAPGHPWMAALCPRRPPGRRRG